MGNTNFDVKLGLIPSEPDYKVHALSRILPLVTLSEPPETFCFRDLSILKTRIKDQGSVGSCVAHALSTARELKEEQQLSVFNEFSTGFIYANRQPNDYQGEGMILDEALRNLRIYGDCFQTDFPFNIEYPDILSTFNPLKNNLLPKALPHKITSYAVITGSDIYQVKQALLNLGPCVLAVEVHDSFMKSANGIVTYSESDKIMDYGWHAIALVGWTVDSWIIVNSWGTNHGDSGIYYIPFDYPYIKYIYSITDTILDNYLVCDFRIQGANKKPYIVPNELITVTNTVIASNPDDTTYTWSIPSFNKEGGTVSFPSEGNYEIILDVSQASTGYTNRKLLNVFVTNYIPSLSKKSFFYFKMRGDGF